MVLLRTPQRTHRAVAGTVERGKAEPPDARDPFRIASDTTTTAALIMLLAQDGKLRLSDPVSKDGADVPNGANITVADLLRMRSGRYNHTDAPELAAALDADPGKAYTPREVLDITFRRPPNFAPDADHESRSSSGRT